MCGSKMDTKFRYRIVERDTKFIVQFQKVRLFGNPYWEDCINGESFAGYSLMARYDTQEQALDFIQRCHEKEQSLRRGDVVVYEES